MKWALFGASTIAAEHMIRAIRAQKNNEIKWVISGAPEHAEIYAKTHAIPHHANSLDMALQDSDVQAVYISSTNEKHHPQAMAAIKAGKHVLCEKPLGMSVKEAREMVDAARNAGLVFATNHHLRNSAAHIEIKNLLNSGIIGKPLSIRIHHAVYLPPHLQGWRIDNAAAGGGVIVDITVHDIDTVRFYLEEDPIFVSANACTSGLGQGVEDSVMSLWEMPSGVMVMSHESFTHKFAGTSLEIHGTEGSIFSKDVMTQAPIGTVELRTANGTEAILIAHHDLYIRSVARFVGAIVGTDTPAATGEDGIKSLEIALIVREAARTGKRLSIKASA